MKIQGRMHIQAARDIVFARFTDAEFVAQCIPDVQSVQTIDEGRSYRVVVAIGFGAARNTFDTLIEFVEMTPGERARIRAQGRAPGSQADVSALLTLRDGAAGGTEVEWTADIDITGGVASVAMRMLDSVTQALSAQFFECAKAKIEHADA